jgi:hypothetical protein
LRHDFQPCTANGLGLFNCWIIIIIIIINISLLGFLIHHIQSLANVAMTTIACNLLKGENDIWAVMLLSQPELLFTVGLEDLKALLAA